MIRFVHFSDLHLDHAINGRRDPQTGLPVRVVDMLHNLDMVVDYAIDHRVELVLFAGDAYHTHTPNQEYKELFHQRILRLSKKGIPTVLVVGNHDRIKRQTSRNALHEFKSLGINNVHVCDEPEVVCFSDYQVVAIPWQYGPVDIAALPIDFSKPSIAGVHATVWGAEYQSGGEATSESELGRDFVLTLEQLSVFDYVGLGHIHRPQVLSTAPPILYPGSVGYHTWGEINDDPHGFVDACLDEDRCVTWSLIPYRDRPRYDITVDAGRYEDVLAALPEEIDPQGMYRITINWRQANRVSHLLEKRFEQAFSLQVRERSPLSRTRESVLGPMEQRYSMEELLEKYFESVEETFDNDLRALWQEIVEEVGVDHL